MIIGIIGLGYAGLSTGLGLSEIGYTVFGYEKDTNKRDKLKRGVMPFYEEEMDTILAKNLQKSFFPVDTLDEVVQQTDAIYICVPTPSKDTGEIDLSFVYGVAKEIAEKLYLIDNIPILIIKSTVVPGTTRKFKELVAEYSNRNINDIEVAMVPEFLKQGAAYKDFINPDRIVFGVENKGSKADKLLQEMYKTFSCPKIVVDIETAEFSKYASNSFLALKISFANELANVVDAFNLQKQGRTVNVDKITEIMGFDKRINPYFLGAGPGFGGSCFPKDVKALTYFSETLNTPFTLLEQVSEVNSKQAKIVIQHTKRALETLENKKIAIFGLAYKPNTDDTREAPAKEIIKLLTEAKAKIFAWDPMAERQMKIEFPNVIYHDKLEDFEKDNLDAGIIVTHWPELITYLTSKEVIPFELIDTRRIGLKTKYVIGHSLP